MHTIELFFSTKIAINLLKTVNHIICYIFNSEYATISEIAQHQLKWFPRSLSLFHWNQSKYHIIIIIILFGYFEACFEILARQMKKNNVLIFHSYSKTIYLYWVFYFYVFEYLFIFRISSIELNTLNILSHSFVSLF